MADLHPDLDPMDDPLAVEPVNDSRNNHDIEYDDESDTPLDFFGDDDDLGDAGIDWMPLITTHEEVTETKFNPTDVQCYEDIGNSEITGSDEVLNQKRKEEHVPKEEHVYLEDHERTILNKKETRKKHKTKSSSALDAVSVWASQCEFKCSLCPDYPPTNYRNDFEKHLSYIHKLSSQDYQDQHDDVPSKVTYTHCQICKEAVVHDKGEIIKHLKKRIPNHPNYKVKPASVIKWYYEKYIKDGAPTADEGSAGASKGISDLEEANEWASQCVYRCQMCPDFEATKYKHEFMRHTSKIHGLSITAYSKQHGGVPHRVIHMECHICQEVILHDRVDLLKHLKTKKVYHPGANKNNANKSENALLKWYHQKFVKGVKRTYKVKPWTYKKMKQDHPVPLEKEENFSPGPALVQKSVVGSNNGLTPGQEAQLEQIFLTLDHIPTPSGRKAIAKRLHIKPSRLHIIDTWFINRQAQQSSRLSTNKMDLGLYTKPRRPRNDKKPQKTETEGSRKSSRKAKLGDEELKPTNGTDIETMIIDQS